MAHFLLDSDALADFLNDWPATVALVLQLLSDDQALCTCDVVLAEVFAGIRPDAPPDGIAFVNSLQFLPISREFARQAGAWRYMYARQGIQLPATDMLIAATAIEHNATLVTGNLRHYPMPELSLLPLPR